MLEFNHKLSQIIIIIKIITIHRDTYIGMRNPYTQQIPPKREKIPKFLLVEEEIKSK